MLVNHLKFGGKIYQGKYDVNWFIMRVKKTNIPGFVKHQELLQVDYHGKCLHIPEKKNIEQLDGISCNGIETCILCTYMNWAAIIEFKCKHLRLFCKSNNSTYC